MTSPDENAATEKNNKESLEMDKQFQKKESPQDSICSLFIMLSFMQCKELTRIHQ